MVGCSLSILLPSGRSRPSVSFHLHAIGSRRVKPAASSPSPAYFGVLWIYRTTCCTTNPQQIESLQQIPNTLTWQNVLELVERLAVHHKSTTNRSSGVCVLCKSSQLARRHKSVDKKQLHGSALNCIASLHSACTLSQNELFCSTKNTVNFF